MKNHSFKTEGKVLLEPGWQKLYGLKIYPKESLIALDGDVNCGNGDIQLDELETKPPALHGGDTAISHGNGWEIDEAMFKERQW